MKTTFDKYELIEKIGQGGMAEVFLAKSIGAEGLEKILVIKRVLPALSSNVRFVEMFIDEAKIAVALNHPNIVQIYDFGKVDEDFYLAMEHVDGWDLGRVIKASRQARPMSVGDAMFVAIEIAKGLDYAHRRCDAYGNSLELVHRDISPQNVLVSRDGTVKIVDFGIAKATTMTDDQPHVVKGKFSYMSPEQATGEALDHRSDLFSLGVVLFEMVCGRTLFRQNTQEQTLSLVKSAVVPDIASLNRAIPEALEGIVYKSLARDPDERFQSAREFQQALMRVLYSLEDMHDGYSLSDHIAHIEPQLNHAWDDKVRHPSGVTRTDMLHTNAMRSQPHTTQPALHLNRHTTQDILTPVTPSIGAIERDKGPAAVHVKTRERKEVVLICGALDGMLTLRSQMSQERWLQVFQEYTRMIDSIAFKCDGIIHRVNERGFLMLLGLPVSSENDAERAARVAMDLQDALAGINLSLTQPLGLTLGLGLGEVILEQIVDRDGRRYDWSFYDESNHYAEALAEAGLGREILVGGQVYRRIRREFKTEEIDNVRLPQTGQPARVYRLISAKSVRARFKEMRNAYHDFYGRELELKSMRAAYRGVMMDQVACAYVITAEQGVGKSTLVEEFLRGLDPRDVRVVRGVVSRFDQDVPMGGMSTLMADLLRLGPPDDLRLVRSTLETRVMALFPEEAKDELDMLIHSIGGIFGIRYPGASFDELSGEERRRRIAMSLKKLLRRFAKKKPFVIAIEDAQYIDDMTLEVSTQLFESRYDAPLFLIMTLASAKDEDDSKWRRFMGTRYSKTQRLLPLSPSESSALTRDLLQVHRVEDEVLVENIVKRSGGNPFYIREIVEALRDRGILNAGERQVKKLVEEDVQSWLPASVEGLIQGRLGKMPLHLKNSLQKLSLMWTPFHSEEVEAIFGAEVLGDLHPLADQGFLEAVEQHQGLRQDLEEISAPPVQEYRFTNQLFQEVVARAFLPEESQPVHRAIASYLVVRRAGRMSVPDKATVARHYDGANDHKAAAYYYLEAAKEAFNQFGAAESMRLSERAMEHAALNSEQEFALLRLQEEALRLLGQAAPHKKVLDRLGELVQHRGDPKELASWHLQQSRHHYDQSQYKTAMLYVQTLRDLCDEHDLDVFRARSWQLEAYIVTDQGRLEYALELIERACAVFYKHDENQGANLISAYNMKGVICRRRGRLEEAIEAYEHVMTLVHEGEIKTPMVSYVHLNLGLALVYAGEFSRGMMLYKTVLKRARTLGLRRDEAGVLINMGHGFFMMGDITAATSCLQRGLHLARKVNASYILADGEVSLGMCHIATGNLDVAQSVLGEGLRLAESIPHVYLAVHAMLGLAEVKLILGEPKGIRIAIMQAEDSYERCAKAGMVWGEVAAQVLLARAHHALGDHPRALALIDAAYAIDSDCQRVEMLWWYAQLHASSDVDTTQAVNDAHALLMKQANSIESKGLRGTFLAKPLHQDVIGAWQALST